MGCPGNSSFASHNERKPRPLRCRRSLPLPSLLPHVPETQGRTTVQAKQEDKTWLRKAKVYQGGRYKGGGCLPTWPGQTVRASYLSLICGCVVERSVPKTQSANEWDLELVSGADVRCSLHSVSNRGRSRGARGPPAVDLKRPNLGRKPGAGFIILSSPRNLGTTNICNAWKPRPPSYRRSVLGQHWISKLGWGAGGAPFGCPSQSICFQNVFLASEKVASLQGPSAIAVKQACMLESGHFKEDDVLAEREKPWSLLICHALVARPVPLSSCN
jgi:hypothetical protein